jgi:hypothetical protein
MKKKSPKTCNHYWKSIGKTRSGGIIKRCLICGEYCVIK